MNVEQLKADLQVAQDAIKALTAAGVAIPGTLTAQVETLTKKLAGNSSQQTADALNKHLKAVWVKYPQLADELLKIVGDGVRVKVVKTEIEEGGKKHTIPYFEVGSAGGTGKPSGQKADHNPANAVKYDSWTVGVLEANPNYADYKEKTGTFTSAQSAVAFILNNGKNPLGRGAEYGKGSNMVVTLCGASKEPYAGGLSKQENFQNWFTLEGNVATSEAPVTAKTAEATA